MWAASLRRVLPLAARRASRRLSTPPAATAAGDPVRVTARGVPAADADALADALLYTPGVLSVTLDEDRGDGGPESPIFTDGATAPRELWARCALTAVLAPGTDAAAVAAAAAADAGVPPPAWGAPEAAPAAEWEAVLRGAFEATRAAAGVWIVPEGDDVPAAALAERAAIIRVCPGLAFGTGAHATTALCVAWLADHRDQLAAARSVVDYGSGSGILAATAAVLGARRVVATDCEPQAVSATAATADANGVGARVAAVRVDATPAALPAELPAGGADVVVANVLAGPLASLAPLLSQAAAPGAAIALSGILAGEQAEAVAAAYKAVGVELAVSGQRDGWVVLSGCKR